jgi:four helix bundle protein
VPVSVSVSVPEKEYRMTRFHHERLDVYQTAIEFVVATDAIALHLPRGRNYLADQLRRAATSIALNIAEGAGEFSRKEKSRFYRIARRSATECAAALDVCQHLELGTPQDFEDSRELLHRIISMLTRLTQVHPGTETETGTETGLKTA